MPTMVLTTLISSRDEESKVKGALARRRHDWLSPEEIVTLAMVLGHWFRSMRRHVMHFHREEVLAARSWVPAGEAIRWRLPLFSFLDTLLNDDMNRQVVMSSLLLLCWFWSTTWPLGDHLRCLTLTYNPVNKRYGPGEADVSHAKALMVPTSSLSNAAAQQFSTHLWKTFLCVASSDRGVQFVRKYVGSDQHK
jgi:hypothetical protein